jgi:TRAP-type C4-dicarboxylate transport system permease small subunit
MSPPGVVIAVVVFFAAYAFRYFFGGGLSWADASPVIPGVWTACILGSIASSGPRITSVRRI